MGFYVAGKVLQIKVEDSVIYFLVFNFYVVVGGWDGVMEIRKRIRGLMLEKDLGLSWIEIVKSWYVFLFGDQLYLRIEEVKVQLQILERNMKLEQDIDDI